MFILDDFGWEFAGMEARRMWQKYVTSLRFLLDTQHKMPRISSSLHDATILASVAWLT